MAGVTLTATFDDGAVLESLDRLAAAFSDTRPLLRTIGAYGLDSTRLRFQSESAPDGSAWAALSPAYAALKGGGRNILYASGALMNSLTFEAGANEVSWGSNRIYAAVHQFGATILPKNAQALRFPLGLAGVRYAYAKSVTIPARPYLGLSMADREEIERLGGAYLRAAFYGE